MTLPPRGQFHKHFTTVPYSFSKMNYYIFKTLRGVVDGAAFFTCTVSYTCESFMKWTTVGLLLVTSPKEGNATIFNCVLAAIFVSVNAA
jgi:hypothetical protein